jgi:hypothetical protein
MKTTDNLPYVVDLEPDLVKCKPLASRTAFLRIASRWPWKAITPHFVVDSAFYSSHVVEWVIRSQYFITASVNKMHCKWLHDILSSHCDENSWVAVMDRKGCLWSLFRSEDIGEDEAKGKKGHFLVTNAFGNNSAPSLAPPVFSPEDKKIFQKLS